MAEIWENYANHPFVRSSNGMVWFSSPKQLQNSRTSEKQLFAVCDVLRFNALNLSAELIELQKANCILVCIRQSIISRAREVIYTELVGPHMKCFVPFCSPQYQTNMDIRKESSRGPQRQSRYWGISPMRRGWESWDWSIWRRGCSGRSHPCP